MLKLKEGQIIYIKSHKYKVSNRIEFKEDTWKWEEYEITDSLGNIRFLSVEEDENKKLEYYIFESINTPIVNENEIEFTYKNEKFKLYEKGIANVVNYEGNTDVELGENCGYIDYISKDEKKIISIEKWEDETEKSFGTYIDKIDVKITQEIEKTTYNNYKYNSEKKSNLGIIILMIFIMFSPILTLFTSNIFANKSINKYIERNKTKYTYVTSITNNINKEKAKVYKSNLLTVEKTVKDLIDGTPKGIVKITESIPNVTTDGIGLQSRSEYAYVYLEKGIVYIQISNKKYLDDSGKMYHSRHHNNYYRGYRAITHSKNYTNYANFARQSSVNSRVSSGGGTSSGK